MNIVFLLNRFEHLRQCYNTEKEFTDHLLSGEVVMTIPEVISSFEEYQKQSPRLPSLFKEGDKVTFDFGSSSVTGEILNIHFYSGKVKYDLELSAGLDKIRIYNVDSVHVLPNHSAIKD